MGAPAVDAGTRHVQGRAGSGGQTGRRRQGDDRVHHDASSLSGVASGMPNRAATFLDFDDRLGVLQSPLEPRILPLGQRQFRRQRVQHRGLGSPLDGRQHPKSSTGALPTPVRQSRRIQAFPAQDRSDPTNFGGHISLRQNTQLRLRCKSPTPWTI